MSGTTVGDPPDGVSETFVIAQSILRLASSPWSTPTPQSLELAVATYQAALRLQSSPPVYQADVAEEMKRIQQQLASITEELRITKEELRKTREETCRTVLELNERLSRFLDQPNTWSGGPSADADQASETDGETDSALLETVTAAVPEASSNTGAAVLVPLDAESVHASEPLQDRETAAVRDTSDEPLHNERITSEPAAPQASEERWAPTSVGRNRRPSDLTFAEEVEKKVMGLLNKAAPDNADSIADQIASYINTADIEKRGEILLLIISLIFDKATDEPHLLRMYALLCAKLAERMSPDVWDGQSKNRAEEPIVGGQLFLKYLLNTCQRNFQSGWYGSNAAADAETLAEMGSDEYYVQVKAKRQGLGLIQLIGELFKIGMVRERIIHECIKKLLPGADNAREAEIESLCKFLTTVGARIDTLESRIYMEMYFGRLKTVADSDSIGTRARFMIQDLLELRQRNWEPKPSGGSSSTSSSRPFNAHGNRTDLISVLGRRSSQQPGNGRASWWD